MDRHSGSDTGVLTNADQALTVWALKLSFRAYRDFYDQIWTMLLYTAMWWLALVTVVLAPPATLLLFHVADPRKGPWEERITFREAIAYFWQNILRGWKLFAATGLPLALIAFNLQFYGGSDGIVALIAPIWLFLLIGGFAAFCVVFAVGGTTDDPAGTVLKRGLRVTGLRLPAILLVLMITFVLPSILITSVIYFLTPLVLALPGLLAVAMTRLVLPSIGEAIPEPNKPTEERLHEKRAD
jgi:hypothetical protein